MNTRYDLDDADEDRSLIEDPTWDDEPDDSICGHTEAKCVCALPPHTEGPHQCECEGSWQYVNGEFVIVSPPRLDVTTGLQVEGYDPDPAVYYANRRAMEAVRLVAMGTDPLIAAILSGPPLSVPRGGIRYITPPEQAGL